VKKLVETRRRIEGEVKRKLESGKMNLEVNKYLIYMWSFWSAKSNLCMCDVTAITYMLCNI